MSFEIEQTIKDMLDVAKDIFAQDWPMIKDDMQRVLNDEKEALEAIALARARNEIDDSGLKEQLADEKEVFQAGLSMVRASTKATIQRAIDAVSDVFSDAVETAL